jgi:hypothetical protein
MAKKEHTFMVTVIADATSTEVRQYIENAVWQWGGQRHPDDPFFGDNKEVIVTRGYRPKR